MARPRKITYDLREKLRKIREAGLRDSESESYSASKDSEPILRLEDRIREILKIARDPLKNPYDMLFMVMYDIEDNRVRTHIAKYLLSKGCIRIQKSVYMARLHQRLFSEISETLHEVQETYDNQDSIVLVPIQAASIGSMKIIGKDIQVQSLTDPPSTLFF